MQIAPLEPQTILPMPGPAQHALAAASALTRAGFLLGPVGIPENPPAPDVVGAREAFREAVFQLEQALHHAGGLPGHRMIEAAIEEAREALMHLTRPGVNPPIADVIDHAWRGGELAREALEYFNTNPPVGGDGPDLD